MVYKKDLRTIVNDICAENNIPASEPSRDPRKYSLVEVYDSETGNARVVVQGPDGELGISDQDWDSVEDNVDAVFSALAQRVASNSVGDMSAQSVYNDIKSRGISPQGQDADYEINNLEISDEAQQFILENPSYFLTDFANENGQKVLPSDLPSRFEVKSTCIKSVAKRQETLLDNYLSIMSEEQKEQVMPFLNELEKTIRQNGEQQGVYTGRDRQIESFSYEYFLSEPLREHEGKRDVSFGIRCKGYEIIKQGLNSPENDVGNATPLTQAAQAYFQQKAVEQGENNIVQVASALAQWSQFALAYDYHNRKEDKGSLLLSKPARKYASWKGQVPETNNPGERRFLNALAFLAAEENLEDTMSLRKSNFIKDEIGKTSRHGTQSTNLTGYTPDLSYGTFVTERSPLIHLGHRLDEYVSTLGKENLKSAVEDLGHGSIKNADLVGAANKLISVADESDMNKVFTNLGGNKPLSTKEKSHLSTYILPTLLAYETLKGKIGYENKN